MAKHPHFQNWAMVLNLELLVLNLVGSIQSGDFQQYMKSIQDLISWSFAMDNINYSRSLSTQLRGMTSLSTLHPSVYTLLWRQLCETHAKRSFSGMALDQAHEQLNALVKGEKVVLWVYLKILQPWGGGWSLDLRYRAWSKSLMASLNDLDQSIIRHLIIHRFLSSRVLGI